jgi:RNA polymerase sigma-70 factor, ECF subfamily
MEPDHTISVLQDSGEKRLSHNGKPVEMVDIELIRRVKTGDTLAFEQLFHHYQKRVYNIVFRLVGNESDASELTQEVFVKVYNSINKLRAEEAFQTLLRTVAVNVCRDFGRRKPAREESLDAAMQLDDGEVTRDIADPSAGPEKLLLNGDRQSAVRKAVASLSPEHRAVIVMHHLEGLDVAEIAKMMSSPVGTIKSRLARAREELRRKLAHYIE